MAYTWIGGISWLAGGSQIDMGARNITFDFNRFAAVPQIAGDNGPHEIDLVGNANANIMVEGIYFMNTPTNTSGSVRMQQPIAGSMLETGSFVWFHDDEFSGTHRVGSWFGGSVAVIPTGFKATRNIQSEETGSQIIQYQMTIRETKEF